MRDLPPSRLARRLRPYTAEALFATWLACDEETIRGRLRRYHDTWRHVRPVLDGNYLRSLGIPPGPIYRRVLDALLDAKIDGLVPTAADERTFIGTQIHADTHGSTG